MGSCNSYFCQKEKADLRRQVEAGKREIDAAHETITNLRKLAERYEAERDQYRDIAAKKVNEKIDAHDARLKAEAERDALAAALRKIEEGKEVPDPLDNFQSTIMVSWTSEEAEEIAHAALQPKEGEQ